MPRTYRRRRYRSSSRRRDGAALLGLLVLALILLLLIETGESRTWVLPSINMPPLSNIPIPETGERINIDAPDIDLPDVNIPDIRLPDIQFPAVRFPESWKIGEDTEVTAQNDAPDWGVRAKTSGCLINGSLPDPQCTPGALTPTTREEVCSADYAASIPTLPGAVEEEIYEAYGIDKDAAAGYRVDRLVPYSLGGTNGLANLWPIPLSAQPGSAAKQQVENYLHNQVCSGEITLAEAQQQIATNWTVVYNRIAE